MANGQYVGVNGVARKVTSPYIGVEGVARKVTTGYVGVDGVARMFFAPEGGGAVVLEVEKVTSKTYANGTIYENEEFILLNIFPKTGGTVSVTYGGLTKTITDTSGAEEPNAQQVFFGTFNGVSDSVATPTSGELTIDGDYYAFGQRSWEQGGKMSISAVYVPCIKKIISYGMPTVIPPIAFYGCESITNGDIPLGVTRITSESFAICKGLKSVNIPKSVSSIDSNPFRECENLTTFIVESGNSYFSSENGVLFDKNKTRLISYPSVKGNYTIPLSVTSIDNYAFGSGITSVIVLATTPPALGLSVFGGTSAPYVQSITVPKGCGDTYKAAEGWSGHADLIVEAT